MPLFDLRIFEPSPENWRHYPFLALRKDNHHGVLYDHPSVGLTVFRIALDEIGSSVFSVDDLFARQHECFAQSHHLIFEGWEPDESYDDDIIDIPFAFWHGLSNVRDPRRRSTGVGNATGGESRTSR
jgi:hypothetical protein